ncbi:hypothetical protein ACRCPS_31225 [Pseudomonas aeruginosa]
MSKTAVQIDLAWVGDETQTLRVHAILDGGKLASTEMYGHLYEESQNDGKQMWPCLLQDDDGNRRKYVAEWGYNDKSRNCFEFQDRPLEIGQEVMRTDVIENADYRYVYKIVGLLDLLA